MQDTRHVIRIDAIPCFINICVFVSRSPDYRYLATDFTCKYIHFERPMKHQETRPQAVILHAI